MKALNKITGEIRDFDFIAITKYSDDLVAKISSNIHVLICRSIEQLNSEWEDYAPKEPLIKDEKVRKAVRAWAEANNFLDEIEVHSLTAGTRFSIGHYDIEFLGYFIYDLESNKTYTIAELCGEEDE